MPLTIDGFLVQRQLQKLARDVVVKLCSEAEEGLDHFNAVNSRLLAQLRQDHCGAAPLEVTASGFVPVTSEQDDDAAWATPEPRVARANVLWREEKCSRKFPATPSDRLRVAIVLGGGMGDLIKMSVIIPGIAKSVGGDLYVIADNKVAPELFRNNPYIKDTLVVRRNPHELLEESLIHLPLFDLLVTWKYSVEHVVPPTSRLPPDLAHRLTALSDERAEEFRRYNYCNEIWPKHNYAFGHAMTERALDARRTGVFTALADANASADPTFFPDLLSLRIADAVSRRPYITVHQGFDLNHLPEKSRETRYGATKNISIEQWIEIVAAIRHAGFDVVQLGASGEEEIPGATRVLNGQTTVAETAMILKGAACHVDTEGGLVHLAAAVHTRSVVLFGPTPVSVFGYTQNINIEPQTCKACWYVAPNWVVQCPRLTEGPACMAEHKPHRVVAAIDEILCGSFVTTGQLVAQIQKPDEYATVALLSHIASVAQRARETIANILIVGDDPDAAAIKHLQGDELGDVATLIATDVPGRAFGADALSETLGSTTAAAASIFNLPTASESVDLILCHAAIWTTEYADYALREMLRVLKPGGLLAAWAPQTADATNALAADFGKLLGDDGYIDAPYADIATAPEPSAFLIEKRVSPARRYPRISGASSPKPGQIQERLPAAPQRNDEPENLDPILASRLKSELEIGARGNDEFIFDTYRFHLQRKIVNDQIWMNRRSILERNRRKAGWISTSIGFCDGYASFFTLDGWYDPEVWGIWGCGHKHTLLLPLTGAPDLDRDIVLDAHFDLLMMNLTPQRRVEIVVGDDVIDVWTCRDQRETRRVRIPAKCSVQGAIEVQFRVEMPIVPSHWGLNPDDHRVLGMGLHAFRYGYAAP